MRVRQHIPGFVSGVEPYDGIVDDLAGLMALDWIGIWQVLPGFERWSITQDGARWLLMAEMANGKSWVVAYLDNDIPELPRWAP